MVFICHSSEDKSFVNVLAARLMERRIHIWLDMIEIQVGDSLITKIEDGLRTMDYLIVVLSPDSVGSAWCQEELRSAMSRQIAERKTIVLPVMLHECEVPMFLRDKKYADFRVDFDEGFDELFGPLKASLDMDSGKVEDNQFFTDFGWDYGVDEQSQMFVTTLDTVSFSKVQEFSVIARAIVIGNETATKRYQQYVDAGFEKAGAAAMLSFLAGLDLDENYVMLEGSEIKIQEGGLGDENSDLVMQFRIEMRRIGRTSTGHVMFHWGSIFEMAFLSIRQNAEKLDPKDRERLLEIVRSQVPD